MKNSNYIELDVEEQKTFRTWLKDLLKNEIVTIRFIKLNGSERLMRATLKEEQIAKVGKILIDESNTVIRVTDIDLGEWRSIRYDSIKEISFSTIS
jgi:DNA-binding transcriptional ArsR family regulator